MARVPAAATQLSKMGCSCRWDVDGVHDEKSKENQAAPLHLCRIDLELMTDGSGHAHIHEACACSGTCSSTCSSSM